MKTRQPFWLSPSYPVYSQLANCSQSPAAPTVHGTPARENERRIVLVDLFWTRDKDPRVPLGHAALLAALRQNPALDVRSVVIPVNRGYTLSDIAGRILDEVGDMAHFAVGIGIGAYIWNERILRDLLPMLRTLRFTGRIILGGPQISYVEDGLEALYPEADVFIRGHAETALADVVRSTECVSSEGVHFAGVADRGKHAKTTLETLPSPWLSGLIPLRDQAFLRWETQRGCQFKCTFCQHRQPGQRVKGAAFPLSRIMEEIDLICRSGVREVAVLDPVFNSNEQPGHAVSVLNRFAEQGYTGRLSLQCRAELIDDAFLDAAQARNVCLEFGLQTIHRKEQDAIKRRNSMSKVSDVLAQVSARGIAYEVSLIFGLPEQTLDSFRESVQWCLERNVPVIRAFPLLLLRGTKLERERERWNLVVCDDTMPEVIESDTFSRNDREAMRRISEALNRSVGSHPDMSGLLHMASILEPDHSRFQPVLEGA